MENAPSNNEALSGTSALNAGLERKRFEELCDLLPGDVNWYDPITPNIVREIVIAIEEREREACAAVCNTMYSGGTYHPLLRKAAADCEIAIRMRSNLNSPTDSVG